MKRFNYLFSIFLVLFIFSSCASVPEPIALYPDDGSRVLFTRSVECGKKGSIERLSMDMTFYADFNELIKNTVVNYSLAIKNLPTDKIAESKVSLKFGENLIPLAVNSILSKESLPSKKDVYLMRFSSELSIEDSYLLLDSTSPLFIRVEFDNQIIEVESKELRTNISKIRNIL